MIFFLRFRLRKEKSRRNRLSLSQMTYPCSRPATVLCSFSLSTFISSGPGRSEMRARSSTLVVIVAENNIDCLSSFGRTLIICLISSCLDSRLVPYPEVGLSALLPQIQLQEYDLLRR